MAIEIERRFLVTGEEWKKYSKTVKKLNQAYISSTIEGWTVRVRIEDNKEALLTLKSPNKGIACNEFEYPIPVNDAQSIWEISPDKIIKTRHEIDLKGINWIVDCFEGNNSPLILAEVEIASQNEMISIPSWCKKELTGQYHWSNAELAKKPISIWPIKKRLQYITE